MNIDTRYLIRWGVPGWIFILTVGFYYLLFVDSKNNRLSDLITDNATNLLSAAAFVLIIGIPIGYILNQIHHVWIWVWKVNHEEYFDYEMKLFQIFICHKNGEQIRERYKYLLTRVHELGGIVVALVISFLFILPHAIRNFSFCVLVFIVAMIVVWLFIKGSRDYYSKNLDSFTMYYVGMGSESIKKK